MAMTHFRDLSSDFDSWFEFWYLDKQNMLRTMIRNMGADLDNGYDPLGKSITNQHNAISKYMQDMGEQLLKFADMDDLKRDKWCYYDLLKRGVIE